jgi:cathepsin F
MRISRVAVLAMMAMVGMTSGVEGRRHHRLATPAVNTEVSLSADASPANVNNVEWNGSCFAKCAAKTSLCIFDCDHPTTTGLVGGNQLGLTCKEDCAAHAAECSAECILADAPITDITEFTKALITVSEEANNAVTVPTEENPSQLGWPWQFCLAKCSAEAAYCVYKCHHSSDSFLGMVGLTCDEDCAAHGAVCTAECSLATDAPLPSAAIVDSSNVEVALKEIAPVTAPAISASCVAKCAAKCSLCVFDCDHPTALGGSQLGLTCKEDCAAHAAECSAECILVSEPVVPSVDAQLAADKLAFESFKVKYGRSYGTPELEAHRFNIFQSNQRSAEELSLRVPSATFGVTQFSDLHPQEFKRQYLNYRPALGDSAILRQNVPLSEVPLEYQNTTIPTSYDWRHPDSGRPVGVTAVKDQGQCGSCWAFSATEELESAWILKGNKVAILSPEQTVDCDTVDQGCNGGDTVSAYTYMKKAGVQSETSYPYKAGVSGNAGSCKYKSADVVAKMSGFTYATPGCTDACKTQDENKLKESLYTIGPVSICVDASPWQTYTSGILTPASGCSKAYDQLDHCVQLVGYGKDPNGQEFWSVRNSWATSWGEAGYIRLSYGTNTCGVADEATQVTVA